MLSAESLQEFASSTLCSTIFLERQLRVHLMRRDRLVFDSSFSPPAKHASQSVHLFVQLTGTFAVTGGERYPSPAAFVLSESEFDRVMNGSITFRSWGERCTIVEARVPAASVKLPVGLAHGAIELAPSVWDALHALESTRAEPEVHQLIGALATTGVLTSDLAAGVVTNEPERFQRVWAVIRPLYGNLATSASLKQISTLAGLSLRQLGRDLRDLTRTFGMFGAGFRDAMRILRLRAAVLLLSAPDGSPSEVARAVGYGSLDAMGRAFRDAHLPAPSIVQQAVRFR